MRVIITAMGPTLEGDSCPRFGRAPWFVIVNSEDGQLIEALENPAASASGGAGIQAAQALVDHKAEAIISGDCGPKALSVLTAAKIPAYRFDGGSVKAALEAFNAGQLSSIG